jgi:hypothetical protein
MSLSFQGHFEAGKFVADEDVTIPEYKRVVVTIYEDNVSDVNNRQKLKNASRRLASLGGKTNDNLSRASIDKLMQGTLTESLVGMIEDVSLECLRVERLRKYENSH